MDYSIIVPVYNRPEEVDELLESLTQQTLRQPFEVIIVEDGSTRDCEQVCKCYADRLDLKYYKKANSGPGQTRNYGAERASGVFLLILDSDVVLPTGYLAAVDSELRKHPCDAFGGPDASHPSFSRVQKAISYSMTSFFTTGGIRGSSKAKLDHFYPRSFNMGIRRTVYQALNGFSSMRYGEDIDFSIRIIKSGYTSRLFNSAWVWHKRRTNFEQFFRQVYHSGCARVELYKRYPDSLKAVHCLPALFTVVMALCVVTPLVLTPFNILYIGHAMLSLVYLYSLIILVDSSIRNRDLAVGALSIPAAFVQLCGYGIGFIRSWFKR